MAHVDALAALICEANPNIDRAFALRFLLHSAQGNSLILRTTRKRKEATVPHDRATELTKIVKSVGLESFAKSVAVDTDLAVKLSEAEFTDIVTKIAKERGTTFVKLFAAEDELGISLRKAHAAINAVQQVNAHMKGSASLDDGPQASR
jgi:hypothetical protein